MAHIYKLTDGYCLWLWIHFFLKGQSYELPVRLVVVSLMRLLTRCFGKISSRLEIFEGIARTDSHRVVSNDVKPRI